jgi:hypothetical protein
LNEADPSINTSAPSDSCITTVRSQSKIVLQTKPQSECVKRTVEEIKRFEFHQGLTCFIAVLGDDAILPPHATSHANPGIFGIDKVPLATVVPREANFCQLGSD